MTPLLFLPVALATLVLAAHFLRQGNMLAVVGLLALLPLLALRRAWVATVARLTLWLGSAVWLYTLLQLAVERQRLGEPWARMAMILGGVAAFTALSSLVFHSRQLRAWYRTDSAAPPAAGEPLPSRAPVDSSASSE